MLGRHLTGDCLFSSHTWWKMAKDGGGISYRPGLVEDVISFCLISSTLAMSVST